MNTPTSHGNDIKSLNQNGCSSIARRNNVYFAFSSIFVDPKFSSLLYDSSNDFFDEHQYIYFKMFLLEFF